MYEDNYEELAHAIILQAVKDFRAAQWKLKWLPGDARAEKTVEEITRFFLSRYFKALTELDGWSLLMKLEQEGGDAE